MTAKHSEAFIEQALVKVFSRGGRTITSVADDLNVSYHTLKYWMKRKLMATGGVSASKEKRPQDWSLQEQLVALQQTHALSGEALQAWCREHGLFAHHLTSWTAAFCSQGKESAADVREVRTLRPPLKTYPLFGRVSKILNPEPHCVPPDDDAQTELVC